MSDRGQVTAGWHFLPWLVVLVVLTVVVLSESGVI